MPIRFPCVMRVQLCQSCWHGGALLQPPSGYMYDLPTPNPSTLLDLRTSGVAREVRAQVWPPIGFTKVWQCAQEQDAYLWRGWFDKEFRQFTWCRLHWLKSIPRSPHLITWIFVFDTECRVNINGRLIYAYFVSLIHFYKCTQHLSQLLEWAANSSATLTSLSALKVVYFVSCCCKFRWLEKSQFENGFWSQRCRADFTATLDLCCYLALVST